VTGRLHSLLIVTGILTALTGCENGSGDPDHGGIPSEAPFIQGAITALEAGSVLVEENPSDVSGSPKALLRLTDNTRILHRSGAVARRSDLTVGLVVSAWVTGAVAESYPVQANALVIVLEP
jgi:hypothetical protein